MKISMEYDFVPMEFDTKFSYSGGRRKSAGSLYITYKLKNTGSPAPRRKITELLQETDLCERMKEMFKEALWEQKDIILPQIADTFNNGLAPKCMFFIKKRDIVGFYLTIHQPLSLEELFAYIDTKKGSDTV